MACIGYGRRSIVTIAPLPMPHMQTPPPAPRVAVVIPSYRVKRSVLSVIAAIGPICDAIYVVDDCCPEQSGQWVREQCQDPRVRVLVHERNQGVGGATLTGMRQALADGMDVMVKLDGDGQMDPTLLPLFIEPVLRGEADYTKGNRFYNLDHIGRMPKMRLFGNACLSFLSKLSSGYWSLFDPTNGYVAIHARVLAELPLDKIAKRFFFESDLLFRLNLMRALVIDIPMHAIYGDESSNLKITQVAPSFAIRHARNLMKRIFYSYYLRDFSIASLYLLLGVPLLAFGFLFGVAEWIESLLDGKPASAGTVMLAGLPIILGMQMLLGFLAVDVAAEPRLPVHPHLPPPHPTSGLGATADRTGERA